MQKQTRHALAVLLPLIFIMPWSVLWRGLWWRDHGADGGHLGSSLSFSGPLVSRAKSTATPPSSQPSAAGQSRSACRGVRPLTLSQRL